MTPREESVAELLAFGLPDKSIARELGISVGTVKVYTGRIFRILGAFNRTQAAVMLATQKASQP